jgi:ribosomal protein L11 methyltransferase
VKVVAAWPICAEIPAIMVVYSQRISSTDVVFWEERLAAAKPASVVLTHEGSYTLMVEATFMQDTVPLILQAAFGGEITPLEDTPGDDGWEPLPARIGNRFVVGDSIFEGDGKRKVLCIDAPPTVFGGHCHPTALACLRIAVGLAEEGRLPEGFTCLDVGCGTGILGISAALLGASEVDGIDLCEDAVRCAETNAEQNGVTLTNWQCEDLSLFHSDNPYDLVFANLYSDLLEHSFDSLRSLLAPQGHMIISGILDRFSKRVLRAALEVGLQLIEIRQRGPWVSGLLVKA